MELKLKNSHSFYVLAAILSLSVLSLFNADVWAQQKSQDCLQKYKSSLEKKKTRYKNAKNRYMSNYGLASNFTLTNARAPKKSDFDMFEEDIIEATEFDLSAGKSLRPALLEEIYNETYEKHSDITYQKIQNFLKLGFHQGEFCHLLGKKRNSGVKRYVVKKLNLEHKSQQENQQSAVVREPAVLDINEEGKEYLDIQDELEHPLERSLKQMIRPE